MRVSESRALILLAVVLDGRDQGDGVKVPHMNCMRCGNFMVRFEASPGLQQAAGVAHLTEACVDTSGGFMGLPCGGALAAKPLLDALKTAAKA